MAISSFADSLIAGSRCAVIFGPRSKFTFLGNIADKNIVAYGNKRRGIAEDGRKDDGKTTRIAEDGTKC